MSTLFFKVSWPHNIEKYRDLQKQAKRSGRRLTVKNMSRTRGIPMFLFYLTQPENQDRQLSFHSLDEVQASLGAGGAA